MREIKFRFWLENKEEAFMCYPNYYLVGRDIHGHPWFDKLNTETHKYTEDQYEITPLQYTGLKDKNGTEIYEGDIYLPEYEIEKSKVGRWKPKPLIVKWTESRYRVGFNLGAPSNHMGEVLGNIYENPELLK